MHSGNVGSRAEPLFQAALSTGLAVLGFFILFSTAGTIAALVLLLLLCLASAKRIARLQPWREPVLALGLALMAWITLRIFVGEGPGSAAASAWGRYRELLMVPLLWGLLRIARHPSFFVGGLLAGAMVLAALHWLTPFSTWAAVFVDRRSISAGFGLAVCAFLLFEHARLVGGRWRLASLAGSAFLVCTVLFMGHARTGHLMVLLLGLCAAWRAAPRHARVGAMVLVVVAGMLLGALSQPVRTRMAETVAALDSSRPLEPDNFSTRARFEFLRNGYGVAMQHGLLGAGWVGYEAAYRQVAAARATSHGSVPGAGSENPHNEYLLQLGAGGIPALLLFLCWLAAPLWRAVRRQAAPGPWAPTAACVSIAFAVGCVFNSLLLDFVEGHVYCALLAWLLADDARAFEHQLRT
ncbi:MAG TPA: O-antigen ligase family protein [Ramlibacter sp.]|jgi:O-antigen ligase|nr:O-antigen ligase family protein [Ramlibacter sp.]